MNETFRQPHLKKLSEKPEQPGEEITKLDGPFEHDFDFYKYAHVLSQRRQRTQLVRNEKFLTVVALLLKNEDVSVELVRARFQVERHSMSYILKVYGGREQFVLTHTKPEHLKKMSAEHIVDLMDRIASRLSLSHDAAKNLSLAKRNKM